MENQIQDYSEERRKEEGTHLSVGYLVPSKKVKGELEFKRCIESQQQHLNVYYDLKDTFNLKEDSNTFIGEVEGLEGYHLLEPLYQNRETNSMVYVDALNASTHDFSEILTSTVAYKAAIEQIGYQESYSRNDMEVMLDKMNQEEIRTEKGNVKVK